MSSTNQPESAPRYLKNTVRRKDGRIDHYAYTYVDGQRRSLGRHGDPKGFQRFNAILAEWNVRHDERESANQYTITVAGQIGRAHV